MLFFDPSEIPALVAKMDDGGRTIIGSHGAMWENSFRGIRDATAISTGIANLNAASGIEDIEKAYEIVDGQWDLMTPSEQADAESNALAHAAVSYSEWLDGSNFWAVERYLNNWMYLIVSTGIFPILYTPILFPDAPDAALWLAKAVEAMQWLFQARPGDGVWNHNTDSYDVVPTVAEMYDEAIGSVRNYGHWVERKMPKTLMAAARHTDWDPWSYLGSSYYTSMEYWTYILSYAESDLGGAQALAGYTAQYGHGEPNVGLGFNSYNRYLLRAANEYNEPVFAWHFYHNPSLVFGGRLTNYAADWDANTAPGGGLWSDVQELYDWAEVAPSDPATEGWPLFRYFPLSAVAVIRKSWAKGGAGSGVITMRSGPGGSHDRPCTGAVIYHADDAPILGSGPYNGSAGFASLVGSLSTAEGRRVSRCNNTLHIDDGGWGYGQISYYASDGMLERQKHGTMEQLADRTYRMSPDDDGSVNFVGLYGDNEFGHNPMPDMGLQWTRKVRYDDVEDILWIKDVGSSGDGVSWGFRWNWVTDNPVITDSEHYELADGSGYTMSTVCVSGHTLVAAAELVRVEDDGVTPNALDYWTIYMGADSAAVVRDTVRVVYAIGPQSDVVLDAYKTQHQGSFVESVTPSRTGGGDVQVDLTTDELTTGSISYGTTPALGSTEPLPGGASLSHSVVLPSTSGSAIYFEINTIDQWGDTSVDDDGGSPYFVPL